MEEEKEERNNKGKIIRRDSHWLEYYAIIKHYFIEFELIIWKMK